MSKTEQFENSARAVARNDYWLWWEQATQLTPAQQSWRRGINRVLTMVGNQRAWAVHGVHSTLARQLRGWEQAR